MILFKSKQRWIVHILLMFTLLFGCKNENRDCNLEEDENVYANIHYHDFDKVENLSAFFDSIRNEHGIPMWMTESEEFIQKEVLKCIKYIDGYRRGNYKYYPDSLVKSCIDFLGFNCAIIENHSPGVDLTYAEWFLMLTAYYSPDITCLVHMQTPNHRAGVLNFGSQYNYNPWWSYLFFKREKGFEVRRIKGYETKIEKIFQLEDRQHRLYYLCSNNISNLEFLQVLFWAKGEYDVVYVGQYDSLHPQNETEIEYDYIYFNPDKKVWHYCNVDNLSRKLVPVSDIPALKLVLDGEKSRFIP